MKKLILLFFLFPTVIFSQIKVGDTVKVKIIKDSTFSVGNKIERVISTETKLYKNKEKCFDFCNCTLLIKLVWPLTVLFIVAFFFRPIKNILTGIGKRIERG